MECLEAIKTRRSIRHYQSKPVERETILKILEAAHWAPSGKNNQPWRFVVITEPEIREKLAELTVSGRIIGEAPVCIGVFMDKDVSYHREKDLQSIGACIQNMLLAAHCLGLGSVWLGEILKNKDKVEEILQTPPNYDFMALIAIGYPAKEGRSTRRPLEEVIYKWI